MSEDVSFALFALAWAVYVSVGFVIAAEVAKRDNDMHALSPAFAFVALLWPLLFAAAALDVLLDRPRRR